ncbi:MAG: TldD/PmbA family protein [bacterium]
MSRTLLDQARDVIRRAQKRGAQGVRASVYRSRRSRIEWRDGKLDRLRESTRMGLGVTLFVDGRYSSNSTSDLRPEAIDRFLEETIAVTRVLAKDKHRVLADPSRYTGRFQGDLKLYDGAGIAAVNATERQNAVKALEAAARGAPGSDKIVSVSSSCSDSAGESALVCSNGMEGSRQAGTFVIYALVYVRDAGHRKPVGWWYAVERRRSKLPSFSSVGQEATRRALVGIGAKPEKSGMFPCIIENTVASRLFGGLLSPLYGRSIQQKRSFLAGKIGKQITSPLLSITDTPHLPFGLGSGTYDQEGMSTRKMPLFDKGVLKTYLLDTYYASKLGLPPTAGSTSNLVFSTGKRDLKKLLQAMGTGVLITGFSGGNSNSATGDFSIGIRGQWIEKGRPTRAVSEMNLAGNHLSFWKQLRELGNDPFPYSSMRIPSLRFGEVQFSGT